MKTISDLSALDTAKAGEEGATLHVKHPSTGEPMFVMQPGTTDPVPLTLTLLGSDSATWRSKVFETNRRRLREMQGRRNVRLTPEQVDADALELLSEVTTAWTGVVVDGKSLPCNAENAATVYRRLPWIREQADEFANDRENYAGESGRN